MSYEKQNFIKGQILKADHLNHMEDGIVSVEKQIGNISGDGLSQTEKNLILSLFADSAYVSTQATTSYQTLKSLWAGTVTVVPVQSISLSNVTLNMTTGGTATLSVTIVPSNATNQTVTWSVSPAGYVTVSNGKIKAVAAGNCTVTATVDGKTASCAIVVSEPQTIPGETPTYELGASKQFLPVNKEHIDTGVKLFEDISAQPTWTILVDADDFGRLKSLSTSPVMFHCGAKEDEGFFSVMAWTNGAVVLDLYGAQTRLGWWGGSTSARWHAYLQIKGTQYRMGTDPANDAWKDIPNYSKNIDASLILGAWRNDDGTIDRYWDGTINQFIVYPKILTNDQIKTFVEEG